MATAKKRALSADHKAALARGRTSARIVKDYLTALHAAKPKRGRRISKEDLERRLIDVKQRIVTTDSAMERLSLAQDRIDLERRIAASDDGVSDLANLEAAFIKEAKVYAETHGLSYAAFREVGVSPTVLKSAGISRAG